MGEVIAWLNKRLPDDAIVTNGAGNYAAFLHRFFQYRGFKTQLAPTSGAMGYGVPAAVAAKIAEPNRMVVSLAGDGCFLMNGQEFATAVQHGANVVIAVIDNGMYGTIRMHQEREYPTRVSRHRAQEPRLRRLRPRLRRPRRDGREDGGLRGRPSSARSRPASPRSSM